MFDDILNNDNDYQLICCASCSNATDNDCKLSNKCFHEGDYKELEGFKRFNPSYRYSKWRLKNENRFD